MGSGKGPGFNQHQRGDFPAGFAHAERTRSSQVVTAVVIVGILGLLAFGLLGKGRGGALGLAVRPAATAAVLFLPTG